MYKQRFPLQAPADEGTDTTFLPPSTEPADPADSGSDPADDSVQWGALADEIDAEDEGLDAESEPEVVAEPVSPEGPTATPTPTPTTPTAPADPVPAVTPVPAAAPAQPTPPEAPPPEVYAAWRDKRISELSGLYALSESDAQALLTEPEVVLPKLVAKAHMEVLEASMRAMQAMMPVMMQQVTQHTERNTQAKGLFTQINPDLADPVYEPAILELGSYYRSKNQQASPEEASRAIGALVRAAFGLTRQEQAAVTPSPAVPAVTPFVPARGGGGMARPAPSNVFEQLSQEFDSEDLF